MSEPDRDDLEAAQARGSDVEPEAGPYRDDLEAARLRVSNLEREAAELRKRNAELERPAPAPEPTRFAAAMTTATKFSLLFAVVAVAGPSKFSNSHYTPHPMVGLIFLGIGFVCWCCSGFRRPWA